MVYEYKAPCSCDMCKMMCVRSPCWGSPRQMLHLIMKYPGIEHKMMTTKFYGGIKLSGPIFILHPAWEVIPIAELDENSKLTEMKFKKLHPCVLLGDNLTCTIHEDKPFEGRIEHHDLKYPTWKTGYDPHFDVIRSWESKRGKKVLKIWEQLTGKVRSDEGNAL